MHAIDLHNASKSGYFFRALSMGDHNYLTTNTTRKEARASENDHRETSAASPCRQVFRLAFVQVSLSHSKRKLAVAVVVVSILRPDALVLRGLVGHVHVVLVAPLLVLLRAILLRNLLAVGHGVIAALFVGHLVTLGHSVLAAVLFRDVMAFGHLLVVTLLLGDLVTLLLVVIAGLALFPVCSVAFL